MYLMSMVQSLGLQGSVMAYFQGAWFSLAMWVKKFVNLGQLLLSLCWVNPDQENLLQKYQIFQFLCCRIKKISLRVAPKKL